MDEDYLSEEELFESKEKYIEHAKVTAMQLHTRSQYYDYERELLSRLYSSIHRVIPIPPNLISPQKSVDEILEMWHRIPANDNLPEINSSHEDFNIQVTTHSSEEVKLKSWPDSKSCHFYDVYYNNGDDSEKLVTYLDEYRKKFVMRETASFVSHQSPVKDTLRAKSISTRLGKYSPGNRLSHLARRKKTFSSENLEALKKNIEKENKSILVPKLNCVPTDKVLRSRRIEDLKPKRALFSSPKMSDKNVPKPESLMSRITRAKRSLFSADGLECGSRMVLRNRTPNKLPLEEPSASKTPSKGTPRKTPRKNTPAKKVSSRTPKSKVTPKRTPAKNTPRKKYTPRKKTPCKVSSATKDANGKYTKAAASQKVCAVQSDLNINQKRKLLLAVDSALKAIGMRRRHKLFCLCGKRLYNKCRHLWTKEAGNSNLSDNVSELMLSMASKHAKSVVKEVKSREIDKSIVFNDDSCSYDSSTFFSTTQPNDK